ncbi:MAG: hypothetical protein ACE5JO_12800 [Candidatus Binatia bacterium]
MTGREREIIEVLTKLEGQAHPTTIGKAMGISPDYAEQLCRDMVWMKYFVKKGLKYGLAPQYSEKEM